MARFEDALPFVLAHEGGWSEDSSDPGGATNHGITLATAQRHGIMDKAALCMITPDQVAAIYRADYWRFSGIASQAVGTKLFDMSVNMGLRTAIRMAQGALNDLGATLALDGIWGPQTEACVNAVERSRMLDLLTWESVHHYQAIVAKRPESAKFLNGWMRRAKARPND